VNRRFFFKNVSASENHQFQIFEKKRSRINELWIPIISKPLKACDFHERTSKEPTIFWSSLFDFFNFFEKRDYMPKSGSLFVENHGSDSYEPP
jgi:hypothetical protein